MAHLKTPLVTVTLLVAGTLWMSVVNAQSPREVRTKPKGTAASTGLAAPVITQAESRDNNRYPSRSIDS